MLLLELNQDVSNNQGVRYVLNSNNPVTLEELIVGAAIGDLSELLRILGYEPEDLMKYSVIVFNNEGFEPKKLARGEFTPISI